MKDVCVIGGSRYFGKRLISLLTGAGARVTVVNRGSSPPPPGVTHVIADRDDEHALSEALGTATFDVVIDQVCYTPRQAATARRVFGERTGRYVMTSTAEVYDPASSDAITPSSAPVSEDAVGAWPVDLSLPWDSPEFLDAHYGEGKRQAETVLGQEPGFGFVSVRSAHVLGGGAEDFTGRLSHYVGRMRAGQEIAVHRDPRPATFVHYREIADALFWAAGGDFTGPVNACSRGELTAVEVCDLIASRGLPCPVYRTVADGSDASPFSFDHYYAMSNARAVALGFGFSTVADWLPAAIDEAIAAL
jgi:nucleoside-diphosphate-sugar epimerase